MSKEFITSETGVCRHLRYGKTLERCWDCKDRYLQTFISHIRLLVCNLVNFSFCVLHKHYLNIYFVYIAMQGSMRGGDMGLGQQ